MAPNRVIIMMMMIMTTMMMIMMMIIIINFLSLLAFVYLMDFYEILSYILSYIMFVPVELPSNLGLNVYLGQKPKCFCHFI